MKLGLAILLLLLQQTAWAGNLTLAEFKQQTQLHYADLDMKQAALNSALDQKQHPQILVEKACAYSNGLKRLKAFAQQNSQLPYAQEEFVFVSQLDKNFNQSLQDLGTSYEKGCLK